MSERAEEDISAELSEGNVFQSIGTRNVKFKISRHGHFLFSFYISKLGVFLFYKLNFSNLLKF